MLTQSFADALLEAEKIITGAAHIQTEQDLAEGYDYLAGHIRAAIQLAWAYQRDFPHFVAGSRHFIERADLSNCPRVKLGRGTTHQSPSRSQSAE